MPARATKKWQVTCTPEQFKALRRQPDFQQLVTLARWANAYRFVQVAMPKKVKQTPADARQMFNSLLFIAALLYEGWLLVKRMGRHFHTYPAWKEGFEPILADGRFARLIEQHLSALRDQAVFHFFEDETARRLAEHEPDGPVLFTSSRGKKSHQTFYDLADIIAMRTLSGGPASLDALFAQLTVVATQTGQLGPAFLKTADALIVEALQRMGFKEHAT